MCEEGENYCETNWGDKVVGEHAFKVFFNNMIRSKFTKYLKVDDISPRGLNVDKRA